MILLGRLTQEPELRRTPQGMAVTTLRVASSRRFRTKAGEDREETLFIDCEVWGSQAENCAEYLVKGQRVLVEGTLRIRKWKDRDDNARQATEIRADRVVFLDKPRGSGEAQKEASDFEDLDSGGDEDADEEIPF